MKLFSKIMIFVICVSSLMLFAACGPVEYSVKDFADVTVIGYTEHGRLSIKVDELAVNKIYADGKKDKTAALRFAETFEFDYEGKSDEDSYFTNGDVVTINVTYDESLARALDITFVDSSFEYTIEGLEDKVEMSPFEGLGVKFNGVAPYGSVQLDKSNCIQYIIDNVTFYCDNHDLSNGDKVVVRAEYNAEIAERNGYVFTEDVKKYTVVGLSKYVTTMMGVSYDSVTAKMRRMVETYVADADTSYKSLDWYFGEEESDDDYYELDSDSDTSVSDDEYNDDDELYQPEDSDREDEYTDVESKNEFGSTVVTKKKITDIMRIKNDFVLSNFKAEFEYTPVCCYYSLNSMQYSDNMFTAVYKVTGTFVCEDSSGSGFINPGDTVVGEIYVTASLSSGSVDIKNSLYYEDTTLNNYHAYSILNFPTFEEAEHEYLGSTKYLVERLDYVEDMDAYNAFVKKQNSTTSRREIAHVTEDTSTDTDKASSKTESEDTSESELAESGDSDSTDSEEIYYSNDYSDQEDYDNGGYDYGYDDGNDYYEDNEDYYY